MSKLRQYFYQSKNKKTSRLLAAGILFSLSALSSWSWAQEAPASPVKVDTVTREVLAATADLMGTVYSRADVQITAGVNGRLAWLAEPGSYVEQGEVLVKMDLLPLQLQQAEQRAEIKRAEINMRYQQHELSRLTTLAKTKAASQFQLDQTQSQYDLAVMDIEISRLKLRQIEDQLSRATVLAPYSGVVTERLVRAGTDVNRSDVLLKFLDTEQLEVRVYVPVKYLPYIRKGKSLNLSATGQQVSAAVTAVIPSADHRSQTFEVRIALPQHLNEAWTAGQLIKVGVPVQNTEAALTVHRDALILRKDGTYVVKVDSDNKVRRLQVLVGEGVRDRVSVTGELADGDKVAIRGAERLNEGQSVVIQ
ncbi:efflux RND transporter periplasmic adaptor subunit [Thalassomonas actiniarum]|uniref:Efflux RND transporter periplasmic adaptor subunit n=1 Tax=Thalassomonas actiniarum TaxID=485447 RepID=A0AAF0C2Q2_9GAMM|nr:efflux RND transporter periplasmic adaptor subunit [Thalassomonas actiniarum]WDD98168.1 efflux RND transporter periplasmic adaptor subunit [Thalassomonas actiniarum]